MLTQSQLSQWPQQQRLRYVGTRAIPEMHGNKVTAVAENRIESH